MRGLDSDFTPVPQTPECKARVVHVSYPRGFGGGDHALVLETAFLVVEGVRGDEEELVYACEGGEEGLGRVEVGDAEGVALRGEVGFF